MNNNIDKENLSAMIDSTENSNETIVENLESLLEKQLHLMRNSRDKAAGELVEKTTEFARYVGKNEILNSDNFAKQRANIKRLYNEITLATAARKDSITAELNKIRRGKNSIGAYKSQASSKHSHLQ